MNVGDHFFLFPLLSLAAIFWKWYWFYGNMHKGINQEESSFHEFNKAYYRVIHYNTLPVYDPSNSSSQIINKVYV